MADFKAFAGLRNDASAERFKPGDLVTADNVDIDASGQLSRRAGRTKVLAGEFHSLWSDGDVCLLVGGTQLLALQSGYTTAVLRDGLTPGARLAYCRVNGRIYWSNGRESGIVEDGRNRSCGLTPPAAQGTARETVGSLPAGTYQYAVTYLRDDGQESGTGLAGRIDLHQDGAGIAFESLPVSQDPGVVAKILYVSECDGAVLYEAAALGAADTTHTVAAPGEAAVPLATQHLQAAPAGQLVAYFRGRLFVAVGNVLYYSEPHAYELFDLRHYLAFDGPITLVAPVEDPAGGGIVVAAGGMTGWLSGTSPEEMAFTPLAGYGAVLGTLAYVKGTLFGKGDLGDRLIPMWVSTAGICVATPVGQLINVTEQRYRMDVGGEGAAMFMPDEARYLAILNR